MFKILSRSLTCASILLILLVGLPEGASAAELEQRTGWLNIVWADPAPDSQEPSRQVFLLRQDDGSTVELEISAELLRIHGGAQRWNGRRVEVTVESARSSSVGNALRVRAVHFPRAGNEAEEIDGGVFGSQPWVSVLCKFSDVPDEPENLAFFQNMYANQPGGLDHYWREVSYDNIDIVGSTAIDWVVLPNPHTFYVPTPGSGSNANLTALFNDCTAAADPFIDFSNGGDPFVGINLMFNGLLDCCAWGGSFFATLDGVTKSWRSTWEPPWGYRDEGVIAHEMGHGFGLPHSTNWDDDGFPYDSPWDVMSAATSYSVNDPTYGRLGKHTLAYHKDGLLGWIAGSQIFEPPGDGSFTITLDHMALGTTSNHRIARIPITGTNRFYTVEARKRIGNYDGNVPGDAIIICEVEPGRTEPAWAVDSDVPPANFGDNEGTMWRVGETFTDSVANITISVDSETSNGFEVTINLGLDEIFSDGFESGDLTAW
ncbi:MAG: hypothetical protein AAF657_01885 [Acidobacteriota bacterium]